MYAFALKVFLPAYFIQLWPWNLTFWPQNLKHSSLSQCEAMQYTIDYNLYLKLRLLAEIGYTANDT